MLTAHHVNAFLLIGVCVLASAAAFWARRTRAGSASGAPPSLRDRVFYSPRPLGRNGQVAFVFPGSGNDFAGMGRDLAAAFPQLIPAGVTPCTTAGQPGVTLGYANCNFRNVTTRGNWAWSKYDGLQTEYRIGGWHGLTTTLSYTYSHTIDNAGGAVCLILYEVTLIERLRINLASTTCAVYIRPCVA